MSTSLECSSYVNAIGCDGLFRAIKSVGVKPGMKQSPRMFFRFGFSRSVGSDVAAAKQCLLVS